jgi:hypothetical protein
VRGVVERRADHRAGGGWRAVTVSE